jgi:hypothetical protein
MADLLEELLLELLARTRRYVEQHHPFQLSRHRLLLLLNAIVRPLSSRG